MQMLFNDGNHLNIDDIKFSSEELNKISDAASELFDSANKLKKTARNNLKAYWDDNAVTSRRMAVTLSAFCDPSCNTDTEEYTVIKEAVTKAKVLELALDKLKSLEKEEKKTMSLDRLPGETAEEHKARLRAYLAE